MSSYSVQPAAAALPSYSKQAAYTSSGNGHSKHVHLLCRFVVTRVLLTALALTRFLQIEIRNEAASSLYSSPFDNASQTWRLVW